jgi:hypothetical protein
MRGLDSRPRSTQGGYDEAEVFVGLGTASLDVCCSSSSGEPMCHV